MSENITQQLKRTFHLAGLRHEAKHIRNSDDWSEMGKIRDRYAKAYRKEERTFRAEYLTRVEAAQKRLIDKAGSKTKDFKHRWFGNDRFNSEAILRQAQREVRAHHRVQMDLIEKRETRELETLLSRNAPDKDQRVRSKYDFQKATNRRDGVERRVPRNRQRER